MLLTATSGALIAVATLFRFDFVLAIPAFLLAAWLLNRSISAPFVLALGALLVFAAAFLAGMLDPISIIAIYKESAAEIAAKANMGGWDLRTKLFVISVTLSPVGWALVLLGGPLTIYQSLRRNLMPTLMWALAIVPLALPLRDMLSAKYFSPLAMFVPFFLIQCMQSIEGVLTGHWKRWVLPVAVIGTSVFLFMSVSLMGRSPFILLGTLASRPVGTHDGFRSSVVIFGKLRRWTDMPRALSASARQIG
jgi:hypothetical protein